MQSRRWRPVAALTLALAAAPLLAGSAVAAQSEASAPARTISVPTVHWLSTTTQSVRHAASVLELVAAQAKAIAAIPPPSNILDVTTWIWPGNGPVTSPFGHRWGRAHQGVDIDAGYGTPVVAAQRGTVIAAGPGQRGYGLVVQIDHGDGITTLYAHLSKVVARVGQAVAQGDLIGKVGATGAVTAAHLHYEVHVGGVPRNPMPWLTGPHSMAGNPG